LQIESVKIDALSFDPANARKHNQKNLDAIKGSLAKFGQQKPIIVDKNGVVVAGNGTMEAAKSLGWKNINVVRTELTGPDAIAFALADNRTAELAEWDLDPLNKTLQSLKDIDFDLGAIGFDDDFMSSHTPEVIKEGLTDPDAVPEQVETRCKPGDLWTLGNHRLLCGDSTNIQHVERLMGGEKADMVFTDPPYNIASDSKNYAQDKSKAMKDLANADWDKNFDINPALSNMMAVAAESVTLYIWTSHFIIQKIWDHLNEWCDFTSYCVWSKPNPMPCLSKRHPTWNTELCVYGTRGAKRVVNFPDEGHFLSCREVVKKSDGSHPTQKPIELLEPLIAFSSGIGQNVLDLFLGSGSTLIACEKTNRKCFGMEIDPHYCDVILKRWEDFTGNKATLESV
jgi:DNA modification methylase